MNINKQKVWEQCDLKRSDFIAFLSELIHISSQGESDIQDCVSEKLTDIGLSVTNIRYSPSSLPNQEEFAAPTTDDRKEHTSVVGELCGADKHQSLMLFAQSDTMPINGADGWRRSPFQATIDNERLYGWGVSDNLVGVASMIFAVESLLDAGLSPKGNVIVASTPSKRRARGIISVLEHGYKTDAAIYVHPAESGVGLRQIKQATPGLLSFRISVLGHLPDTQEPGHTAFHHTAVDPIEKAVTVIQALHDFNSNRGDHVHHPALHEAIGRSTNLHISYINCGKENMLRRVSSECVLAGSMTLIPGESLLDTQLQISRVVETVASKDAWLTKHPPKLDWLAGSRGAELPRDHALYKTTKSAITDLTHEEPHQNPLHIESDIRHPMLYGDIPTVGLGPKGGSLTQTGHHDEWVDLYESLMTIKVLSAIIIDWCGVSPVP